MSSCSERLQVEKLNGAPFTWDQIEDKKGAAFVFFSPECPLSENYSLTMNEFSEKYRQKEILTYIVFPGKLYTKKEIEAFCKTYMTDQIFLLDTDYQLTHYFGASITPEVFLTDNHAQVLYQGKIDNWAFSLGNQRQKITAYYLLDATESFLSNNKINVSATKAVGCLIE